ncbi:MAG: hypothetical protein Q9187_004397 [Circinaria calcarea]
MARLRIKRPELCSRLEASKNQTFDWQSGLQFTEVLCKAGPMRADWVWKTLGSTSDLALFRSKGPGCSSLQNMAIRSAVMNVVSLTAESLGGVPQLDSLHAWKVFAAAYPEESQEKSLKRRQQLVVKPNMALPDYIKPITSLSFAWITDLTLSHITCTRLDLIQLSQLTNIGTLTIGEGVEAPETGLDDGIARAWARAATETGAFSMLRVLACRSQRGITPTIFTYLSLFPLLSILLLEDCNIGPRDKVVANALCWKYSTGKDLSEYIALAGCSDAKWDSVIHASYYRSSHFCTQSLTEEGVEAINHLPVLHFSLGPAPEDAKVDTTGNRSLRCFQRETRPQLLVEKKVLPVKRLVDEPGGGQSKKKRTMRASKQESFEATLMGFGF